MERRDYLKLMAATLGAGIALPSSVFAKIGEPFNPAEQTFFTAAERAQAAALAEAIIPTTDTPGAIEAGVPGWIEVIDKDCFSEADQQVIKNGLAALSQACQDEHGKKLAQLPADQQVAFLTAYDQAAKAAAHQAGQNPRATFLQQFKELTKFTYVNSELGATKAFEFHMTPGKWIASMPLEPGQKAYSF
ncbi:MAG: gluconate 2-dehydrogenase subunit 3 family protein [Verrucomicrobiales bacterium]